MIVVIQLACEIIINIIKRLLMIIKIEAKWHGVVRYMWCNVI